MKKKWNVKTLLNIEMIILAIFCISCLMCCFYYVFHFDIFTSSLLFILIIIFIYFVNIDIDIDDLILYCNPSFIFNFGKWKYIERKNLDAVFEIFYISSSKESHGIDIYRSEKSIDELRTFIEKTTHNIYVDGLLKIGYRNFYITNFLIEDKSKFIKQLQFYSVKNEENIFTFDTTANMFVMKNTFADLLYIIFVKIGDKNEEVFDFIKKLNLNKMIKYFLSFNEKKIDKSQLAFFDYVNRNFNFDSIAYLQDKWEDFDNI